jgi:tRNA dimethylallyltransferase
MTIGTAVPSREELATVPHHFIQDKSIFNDYNVGSFEKDALQTLGKLFQKHDIVIMVGGSGLYAQAVLRGFDDFPEVAPSVRVGLKHILETEGIIPLQQQLKELDLQTYKTIALDNPQRVIRALEICIATKLPYSSFIGKAIRKRNFNSITIGLHADRQKIYDRINYRVDLMIAQGLLEEAKLLYAHRNLNALQTVGYKELFTFFDGEITKEFAIEEIKKNTRRFAKRQLTWFRKDTDILWFDFEEDLENIIKSIKAVI